MVNRRFVVWLMGVAVGTIGVVRDVPAQETSALPSGKDAAPQRWVRSTTFGLATLETSSLQLPKLPTHQAEDTALTQLMAALEERLRQLKQGLAKEMVVVTVDLPMSSKQSPFQWLVKDRPGVDSDAVLQALSPLPIRKRAAANGYLRFSVASEGQGGLEEGLEGNVPAAHRPELEEALRAVDKYPVRLLFLPPEHVKRTFRELLPRLPDSLGGGTSSWLTDGLRWAAVGLDPATLKLHGVVQAESAEAAEALASQLPKLIERAVQSGPTPMTLGNQELWRALLQRLTWTTVDDQVHVAWRGKEERNDSLERIATAIGQLLSPHNARVKADRLKRIALGIHNYESAWKSLPPAKKARMENGRSPLSWRVHILPFLGEMELYSQFRLDEDWDSPHNSTLLEKMPDVFGRVPLDTLVRPDLQPGYTTFLAPVGEGTAFGQDKPIRLEDIRDGIAETILLVEVNPENAVPWTAPQDYAFEVANPAAGLAIGEDGRFLACLVNGAVVPMQSQRDELVRWFRIADGPSKAPVDKSP